ncbi:hypothetical protein [Spirosoma endophyticum]|uniref:Ion channel n=1 Tax=Spirosoma endophyticum TaxID=662367 RepID=A0A1I2GAB0_9BACT|nr:hypothetical protein [Spirosoma endophyticum]SFF14525.1 hypothetical protein SAMN05216167_1313 [Spirosoma endophyticum]
MNKLIFIVRQLFKLFSALVGVSMLIIYLFVFPYVIASKTLPGYFFLIVGFFIYIGIILLTLETIVATFSELYNLKRKTILFSTKFKDGTPKPPSEKPTAGLSFFIILLSYFFIVHVYAITYLFLANYVPNSFDKVTVSFIDAFYLSFTSISVGPAGIQPNSSLTKIITMTEIFWGLIYTILVFSLSASLFSKADNREQQ